MDPIAEARSAPAERAESHVHQADHAELRRLADRIERMLSGLAGGGTARSAGPEVRALLEEFQRRLLLHMEAEEQRGILERAAVVEPRFERRVRALLHEHADLAARTTALVDAGPAQGWPELHAGFVELRQVVRAHEDAENEVLRGAYLEDLGGRG